jgi:hypothetical protein
MIPCSNRFKEIKITDNRIVVEIELYVGLSSMIQEIKIGREKLIFDGRCFDKLI